MTSTPKPHGDDLLIDKKPRKDRMEVRDVEKGLTTRGGSGREEIGNRSKSRKHKGRGAGGGEGEGGL